jgi:acid phosphatase type 7
MTRLPRLFAPAAAALAIPVFVSAQEIKITRGPYPQAASADGMHVVWRVRQETNPVVRYGLAPDKLDLESPAGAAVIRRIAAEAGTSTGTSAGAKPLSAAPAETRQCEVRLTGLLPDTEYYYAVCDGETRLTPEDESYSFRTLPLPGTERPLLMWVVGDSGTGNRVQAKVHTVMREWLEKEKRTLDLYLHVGDMAYGSGLDSEFQGYFFQSYDATLRNTVCWPAFGNHEGKTSKSLTATGPYYDAYIVPEAAESGGVPSGTEAYYSFDVGRVHFIALNSFDLPRDPDGAMAQWLKADLEKAKADWLIAFFHHPPYTKGSHDSDDRKKDKELVEMREHIMPILEGGGVDLVLAGHSHVYERSMLIDGAYQTPTVSENAVLDEGDGDPNGKGPYLKSAGIQPHKGTVAVVAGNGGATLGKKRSPHPLMHTTILEHGSLLLDLSGDTVTGRMLNSNGLIRDTFQLVKRGETNLAHIARPRPPGPFIGNIIRPPRFNSATSDAPVLPEKYTVVFPKGAEWQYLGGEDPGPDWTTSLHGSNWKSGRAGFGFEDGDDATVISDMRGKYRYLCVRRAFDITGNEDLGKLGLAISYDDGFICYINGTEVARKNVESGQLGSARGVRPHEVDGKYRLIPLAAAKGLLTPGRNMIAIEVHNDDLGSSDLSLDPFLVLADEAALPEPAVPEKDPSSDD